MRYGCVLVAQVFRPALSKTELSKVMVPVKVSPPHPLLVGQRTEDWMRAPPELGGLARKPFHNLKERFDVPTEFDRPGSSEFLIDLRTRRYSWRPRHRQLQCDPFDDGPLQPARCGRHVLFAEQRQK